MIPSTPIKMNAARSDSGIDTAAIKNQESRLRRIRGGTTSSRNSLGYGLGIVS